MLKGLLALLLLSLLAEHDDYGYSLVERLRAGGLTDVAEGTVYPALARLERGGFLATSLVPSDRGAARRYYQLSTSERDELGVRRASWNTLTNVVDHFTNGAQT